MLCWLTSALARFAANVPSRKFFCVVPLDQGVGAHPLRRLGVLALDVLLELAPLDAPLAAPAHLDRGQLPAAYHVVHLRGRHVQLLGDVGHEQESRLHRLSLPSFASRWLRRLPTDTLDVRVETDQGW